MLDFPDLSRGVNGGGWIVLERAHAICLYRLAGLGAAGLLV